MPIQNGSTAADFLSRDGAGLRMAVVDDDTVIRTALPMLLPSVHFSGLYRNSKQLLADHPCVDVVVADLKLSGRSGSQGVRALSALVGAGYDVCLQTNERRPAVLVCCLAVGVRGIVHKDSPLSALADAATRTARGEVVITQALVRLAEVAEGRGALPSLTDPERQVLSARACGASWSGAAGPPGSTPEMITGSISAMAAEAQWAIVAATFAGFLRTHSPAELETVLGFLPGDLANWLPMEANRPGRIPL